MKDSKPYKLQSIATGNKDRLAALPFEVPP
ncbi:hypothetical protein BDD43_0798 [Mucilaginibacter gracilis]|uniref:Uncharacterized protein n=1 Tax=Mucilaginibacter gracilis TaxID=423350 RepID=A0A495IV81_9SPHI|nr:hypothetical protein BDD43_0798 [Mucilaginibacter gracilis]